MNSGAACIAFAVFVISALLVLPTSEAATKVVLGSPTLQARTHGSGLGHVRPVRFDAGGFPIYRDLRWRGWGKRSATAQGKNVPDGPFKSSRVQLRASDIGLCDGVRAYRRLVTRTLSGTHWGPWRAFDPRTVTSYAGTDGRLCLTSH